MSVPNLIPHKILYISDYICSCYTFVFILDFPKLISKHILQFHPSFYKGWPSVLTRRRQSAEERTTSNGKPSKALRKSRFNVRTR